MKKEVNIRFYEELNDFLPIEKRKSTLSYFFSGRPSVKDVIEAIGVPHPEIDLIIVNNESVGFDYHLQPEDYISVYPVFEALNIKPLIKLRPKPLRQTKFILDVNLGKLARLLRLCGFDSAYDNNLEDKSLVSISRDKKRIILTRNQQLLKRSEVTHGYWIRNTDRYEQLKEVILRFDIKSDINLFSRCLVCNASVKPVCKEDIINEIPPRTREYFNDFHQCLECFKVYWPGSHFKKMQARISDMLNRF